MKNYEQKLSKKELVENFVTLVSLFWFWLTQP